MMTALDILSMVSSLAVFIFLGVKLSRLFLSQFSDLHHGQHQAGPSHDDPTDLPQARLSWWTRLNSDRRVFLEILLIFLLTRAAIFVLPYLWQLFIGKNAGLGFWASVQTIWQVWDSEHYLHLAQYGYAPTGEKGFLIVFLPLYPLFIKIFNYAIHDYLISAICVSNISLLIGCFFFYKLACLDHDRDTARRSVKYLLIYPMSFFFSMAYTEGLFIALFIITVYLLRLRKYALSSLTALLTVLTRTFHGNFLIIIFAIEFLFTRRSLRGAENKNRWRWADSWPLITFLFAIICGNLFYLSINKLLYGHWFAFADFQSQKWFHRFLFFPQNLVDMMHTSLAYSPWQNLTLWGPIIFTFCITVILLILTAPRLRISYGIYLFAYLFSTYSVYWTISATRYIAAAFPLFIMLALFAKNKKTDRILTIISSALLAFYSITFIYGNLLM